MMKKSDDPTTVAKQAIVVRALGRAIELASPHIHLVLSHSLELIGVTRVRIC